VTGIVDALTAPVAAHPFAGLVVAEAAGLRMEPGNARALFDQPTWDLTGLADAPVTMGNHRKILDFTAIANPRWRTVAREYLLARLAPHHPAVATMPHAYRTPINPNSLWTELRHLTSWFNTLTTMGITTLAEVEQHHCDRYLAQASLSQDNRRDLTPSTVAPRIRATKNLARYTEILSDRYRPGFEPWAGRGTHDVAGLTLEVVNKVPPVPDWLLTPLLGACLYLVHTVAPHVIAEAERVRAFEHRQACSRRGLLVGEIDTLAEMIEQRRRAGIPAYRLGPSGQAQRARNGWSPDDPLIDLAWNIFVVEAVGAFGHRRNLEKLRPQLQRWVGECGVEPPWCRDAAPIPHHRTGEPLAWSRPLARVEFDVTAYAVQSACYYLTAALTGMRASELLELRAGCCRSESRPDGGIRHRVTTRKIKGERFGGTEDAWVVIDDVHHALGVAESLTDAPDGNLLFAADSNTSMRRYLSVREWVNGEHGRRLGLDPIPDGSVSPRGLRRTLAMTLAQRPHGLLAAKIALKHVSVVTTEGYAARPGGHQAAFLAEVADQEEAEHLRLTVAAFRDFQQGMLPAGQGARGLLAEFASVEQRLTGHDPGAVTVVDDRRVERALKAKASTLHIGVANYCWFSDPAKALCLKLAGTPTADQPLLGMCDSARCSQATHHREHRQVWADHAEQITTVFLGNPRLSRLERTRAQTAHDRAVRVIAEIDAAAATTAEDQTR
jgi:hypothetical protein